MDIPEYALENLLAYDGRKHVLESGCFLKFEIRRVARSVLVPHGIAYAMSLHDQNGIRLLGFDNAHPVARPGGRFMKGRSEADHWHRRADDPGRPYEFLSVEKLIVDFYTEVDRLLTERGERFNVVAEKEC